MNKTSSASTIDILRTLDSPTVSNAVEAFNVRGLIEGYASMDLRCRFPELPPMVGYAVTCTADTTSPEPAKSSRLLDLFDAVAMAPKPVVVVVQHKGPDRLRSCFAGDCLCTSLTKLGAVGLVTDGGIRDVKGIVKRAPGFQVFSAGLVVSHGNSIFLEVNVTVSVCGLTVRPGDLLHGDENGLLTVPLEIVDSVPEQAKLVQKKEGEFINFLESDAFSLNEMKHRMSH